MTKSKRKPHAVIQALIDYKDPIEGHDLAKLVGVQIPTVHSAIYVAKQKGYIIHKETTDIPPNRGGRAPVMYKFISGPSTDAQTEYHNSPLVREALKNAKTSPVHKVKSNTLSERCYHFLKARHVTTTSYQVADFFNISNDQATSLIEHVAAQHDCLSLTVSVRVLEVP